MAGGRTRPPTNQALGTTTSGETDKTAGAAPIKPGTEATVVIARPVRRIDNLRETTLLRPAPLSATWLYGIMNSWWSDCKT